MNIAYGKQCGKGMSPEWLADISVCGHKALQLCVLESVNYFVRIHSLQVIY